jgi:lysine-ketoglutarate reductase/saccharopine dehydrogenase-like protein (TIGR00300 family)
MEENAVTFLMCAPTFFEVNYVINPWMAGNVGKAARSKAEEQWHAFYERLRRHATVELLAPQPGLPDFVFTANGAIVLGRKIILGHFLHKERRAEEPYFRAWFKDHGFEVFELPIDLPCEGAGDALIDRGGGWLWCGYGQRTELEAHPLIAQWLDIEVVSLRLIDERFYHLDTCFCPLEGGGLLYYPRAFDAHSNQVIEKRVSSEKRFAVGEADALRFACNAANVHHSIFLDEASSPLKMALERAGFAVIETPLKEFLKAGGSAKCLTLRLTEPVPARAKASTSIQSRRVRIQGHLLASGLLDRGVDAIVDGGGSFRIVQFHLGQQRPSPSDAEIQVSAPTAEILDQIMPRLIELGAVSISREEGNAKWRAVSQPGVAPEGFYATTIYPTEVRVDNSWVRVQGQRMDAVIVIRSEGSPQARCKLFRHLQVGDQVVVGSRGIRTLLKATPDPSRLPTDREFAFMGATVSSERRVELAVERVAWEMHRIRQQGGRIIVVAGPVVVHTGGAAHLARLVREGYVQALLGGNGLAAHDIEQALLGTSLGVDLQRGSGVRGGHRHHLQAINTVRRCGSIAQAVAAGVLTQGIFYECVQRAIPFALAGSIRDDGPLSDTIMDLLKAQDEYARLLAGADLILMLASMLHSIGVGNMTPAVVKLVCVDINPAVVTKLSDRRSVESVGVVTDVGSFLNLLARRLDALEPKNSDSGSALPKR